MSEQKHTPGPWEIEPFGDGKMAEIRVEGRLACLLHSFSKRPTIEDEANARLIAAAPELLEALQRLSAQCERLRMAWQLESDAERTARVVIAKAIGVAE